VFYVNQIDLVVQFVIYVNQADLGVQFVLYVNQADLGVQLVLYVNQADLGVQFVLYMEQAVLEVHWVYPSCIISPTGRSGGTLSRGFEKSRDELSRMCADDEKDDGSNALVNTLRDRVCIMDEQCDKLDREKAVLADLLTSKKHDFEQVQWVYMSRLGPPDYSIVWWRFP